MENKNDSSLLDDFLESIGEIREAEPRPFFYSRLSLRMSQEHSARKASLIYVVGSLTILLVFNFWMIKTQNEPMEDQSIVVSSMADFSDAYNLTVTGYYQ